MEGELAKSGTSRDGTWSCPECSEENDETSLFCEVCEATVPSRATDAPHETAHSSTAAPSFEAVAPEVAAPLEAVAPLEATFPEAPLKAAALEAAAPLEAAAQVSEGAAADDATVDGLWQQLEEMRQKELDERKRQVNMLWAAFDQLVLQKETVWQHGAHTKAASKWRQPIEVNLHRERLALDMLLAMDSILTAADMFRPMVVKFEGEEGVDERGLKVDAFAHFFDSFYHDPLLGPLFELSREGRVLPRRDDGSASSGCHAVAAPPVGAASSSAGGVSSSVGGSDSSGVAPCSAASQYEHRVQLLEAIDAVKEEIKRSASNNKKSTGWIWSKCLGWDIGYKLRANPVPGQAKGDWKAVDPADNETFTSISGLKDRLGMKSCEAVPLATLETGSSTGQPPRQCSASGASKGQARGGERQPKRQRVDCGSADDDSVVDGLSRERVLQLMGRTLAMVLRCGDGYFVADKLPSFVLQLLTTDNCLNTAEESLLALDEWDARDGGQARRLLTHSCAELREHLMRDDGEEVQLCELMSSSMCPEGCQRFKAGRVELTCSSCSYLTDENKHDVVIDCINHNLKSTRIRGLKALRDGFTGNDRAANEGKLDGRDRNCYSFFMLQLFRPAEIALRIRGREIAEIEEAWRHFHVTPSEHKPSSLMARPSQGDFELVHRWFEQKFLSKKDEENGLDWMRRLLRFCTGTDRFTGHGQPADRFEDDRDGIKVEVYQDMKTNEPEKVDVPSAATCARTLYLPVAPHEVLNDKFDAALAQFESEEKRSVGGARIGYA